MNTTIPFRERISCTIPEACSATGIGRSKLYEAIASGQVATSKVGGRRLVLVRSLEDLVATCSRERCAV
jgi:excisionase family DNA binding protein